MENQDTLLFSKYTSVIMWSSFFVCGREQLWVTSWMKVTKQNNIWSLGCGFKTSYMCYRYLINMWNLTWGNSMCQVVVISLTCWLDNHKLFIITRTAFSWKVSLNSLGSPIMHIFRFLLSACIVICVCPYFPPSAYKTFRSVLINHFY